MVGSFKTMLLPLATLPLLNLHTQELNMTLRIGLLSGAAIVLGICAVVWYVLGQLVVGYARMEAEERIDDFTTGNGE